MTMSAQEQDTSEERLKALRAKFDKIWEAYSGFTDSYEKKGDSRPRVGTWLLSSNAK
jgi:hypothetical protein